MKRILLAGLLMGLFAAPALAQSPNILVDLDSGDVSGVFVGRNLVDPNTGEVLGVLVIVGPKARKGTHFSGRDRNVGPNANPRLNPRVNPNINPVRRLRNWPFSTGL